MNKKARGVAWMLLTLVFSFAASLINAVNYIKLGQSADALLFGLSATAALVSVIVAAGVLLDE